MKQLNPLNNFQSDCSPIYLQIDVMRYMGNKKKLLPFIIPVIENECRWSATLTPLVRGLTPLL